MRLAAKKAPQLPRQGIEEGTTVGGYVVEDAQSVHTRAEILYAVTAPDGEPATLVAPGHAYADRHQRARVRRLAMLRSELTHPALIPVQAFGEHEGAPYLITDAQPAETFGDILEERAPLPPESLLAMLHPVGEALDLAHSHGLVHEDLSGESLLLAEGDLVLDSFGLLGAGSDPAWATMTRGDLNYRSPEQLRAEPLGPAANVYSLAALLVHGLTGAPPYQGGRPAVTYGHIDEPPPRVSERAPELGDAVDEVIAWGMAKDPAQRPPSAAALLAAMEDALAGVAPARPPQPSRVAVLPVPQAAPRAPHLRSRRPGAILAAVVAGAAACGVLAAVAAEPFGGGSTSQPAGNVDASALKRLDTQRADLRGRLASADTPQEQAAAARDLAASYDTAVRSMAPGPVASATGTAAEAYSELADAGDDGDASRYADAADAVDSAERELSAAARQR